MSPAFAAMQNMIPRLHRCFAALTIVRLGYLETKVVTPDRSMIQYTPAHASEESIVLIRVLDPLPTLLGRRDDGIAVAIRKLEEVRATIGRVVGEIVLPHALGATNDILS